MLHLPCGYYRYYPSESLWEVNPSFLRILGCNTEEAFRALAPAVVAAPSRQEFWSGASLCGQSLSGCSSWPVVGGAERSMKEIIRGIADSELGFFCWEGILMPESAHGRIPRQLAAAEFWSSFGRLSAGLFHRLGAGPLPRPASNTTSTAAGASTAGAHEAADMADEVAQYLHEWSDGVFSRQVLSRLAAFVSASVPPGVTVNSDLCDEDLLLDTAPAELCGILLSLVHNAIRSCGTSGAIRIASQSCTQPNTPGAFLAVTIADTGSGIPAKLRTHVRRPLFTTAGEGGTGLGLSATAEITFRRGGMLSLDSSPDGGTVVTLQLPARIAAAPAKPATSSTKHDTRILIAHGDPQIAASLAKRLASAGVETDCIHDGASLVERVSSASDHYDVVAADLQLPGLFGLQLARLLSKADPTAHLFFLGDPASASRRGVTPKFEVVSPNAPTEDLLNLIRRLRGEGPQPAGPVVLVADDDPLVRGFIADAVSSIAGEVLEAGDGAEAMEILQARPVDVLIVDLFMPEIEGLETIRSIRRKSDLPRILAISGAPDVFLKTARMLGADVILKKPVTPSALLSTIARILGPGEPTSDAPAVSEI